MSANLKPCPFCGGEAKMIHGYYQDDVFYKVYCIECQARTFEYETPEVAAAMWNQLVKNDD